MDYLPNIFDAWSSFHHPNIIPLFAVVKVIPGCYVIMPRMTGTCSVYARVIKLLSPSLRAIEFVHLYIVLVKLSSDDNFWLCVAVLERVRILVTKHMIVYNRG